MDCAKFAIGGFLWAAVSLSAFAQVPFVGTCAQDAKIEPGKKRQIEASAVGFVQTLIGPESGSAYELFTKAVQKNLTKEQLFAQGTHLAQQFAPTNLIVDHTYLVTLKGDSPGRVVCATDLSNPRSWQSVSTLNVPSQAHVVLSAKTRNNDLAFTIWLLPEEGQWRVQGYWMNVASLADKRSEQLWEWARNEESLGRHFNAALLYAAAAQTAHRGSDFQLGISQAITSEMSHVPVPNDLAGPAPFFWKAGDVTFKVLQCGPIAVGGKIYVIIAHETEPWETESQVDAWNKRLIKYFVGRFPEYRNAFAGVVVRAHERGTTRGFGTVEELPSAP